MDKKATVTVASLTLKYRLHKEPSLLGQEYSIYCMCYDDNGELIDAECVNAISADYERAQNIFDKIVLHRVTPCTLKDVIIDLLCQ